MNKKPTKEVLVNGVVMKVYSIGWLSLLTNRGPANIRRWERLGLLPKPIVTIEGEDRRYYLAAELIGYSEAFRRSNIKAGISIQKTGFKQMCRTFKTKLKGIVTDARAVKKLIRRIPNEKAYLDRERKEREENLKQQARRIVAEF